MRSSFFEYNVAITGIFTSRNAMDVIYNNMANVKTEGYSRQIAMQRTLKPLSGSGRGMIGTGSEVYDIKAIRSFYLDTKYWHQSSRLGEYAQKVEQSQAIEAILNEPSGTSYTQHINNVFDSLQALTSDAGNITYRTTFLGSCESLASVFNSTSDSLKHLQSQMNSEVSTLVDRINELGREIQIYNKQICDLELTGKTANDLRDRRALAIDELSKYVNVEVKEVAGEYASQFKVSINGEQFVDHYSIRELTCVARTYKKNPEDADGLYDIAWKDTLSPFKINSPTLTGQLKGIIDMRDGNNGDYMSGKIGNTTALADRRVQITLTDLNRDDMQQAGTININGTDYSYSNYVYDPLTKTATLEIPPKSGQIDFGTMRVSYTDLSIDGSGDISFKIDPGLNIASSPIIKIGDMKLAATNTSTGYTYATDGTFTITNPRVPVLNNVALANGSDVKIAVSNSYRGIPYYQKRLNEFVRNFASMLNDGLNRKGEKMGEGFTNGYDLYGEKGQPLFTYKDANGNEALGNIGNYAMITASNFTISSIIEKDPKLLACSNNDNPDVSNNEILKSMIEMRHNTSAFSEGTLSNYVESMVITAGIDTNIAYDMEGNQTDIINVFQNQRLSVMGVSLDEEAAFLMQHQQVFNACAKLVNAIDEIYNRLINSLGAF